MLRYSYNPKKKTTLEDIRLALLNFIVAKQRNEAFVIRIEDIEAMHHNEQSQDAEFVGLVELFGIEYKDILHQSKNLKFYSAMAIDLIHRKKAFNCFCDEEKEPYDGRCENLPAEEVIDNPKPFRVRIKKPASSVSLNDVVQGEMEFSPQAIDSFVLLHVDKTPTHTFATTVDDMLEDISFVVQTKESIDIAAKELYVFENLRYDKNVVFAHLPALECDVDVKSLLEDGFLPQAIANYLVNLSVDMPKEVYTLEEAAASLDTEKFRKETPKFDLQRLKRLNKEHLQRLDDKELSRFVGFADDEIGKLAKLFLPRADTTKELKTYVEQIFAKKTLTSELEEDAQKLKLCIKEAPHFEEFGDFVEYLERTCTLDREKLVTILNKIVLGDLQEPSLETLYPAIKNYIKEIAS